MRCLCVFFLKAENRVVDFFRTWHMSCLEIFWRRFYVLCFLSKRSLTTQDLDISSVPSRDAATNMSLSKWLQEDTRDGRDYILRVTGPDHGSVIFFQDDGPRFTEGKMFTQFWREKRHFFCSNKLVKNHQPWWYVCYLSVFCWGEQSDICALRTWFIGVFGCILDFLMLNILHVKWFELMPMSS